MKISELISKLEGIKSKECDLNVCMSEKDEYWGSFHSHLTDYNIIVSDNAQPEGPKSGKIEKALLLG